MRNKRWGIMISRSKDIKGNGVDGWKSIINRLDNNFGGNNERSIKLRKVCIFLMSSIMKKV